MKQSYPNKSGSPAQGNPMSSTASFFSKWAVMASLTLLLASSIPVDASIPSFSTNHKSELRCSATGTSRGLTINNTDKNNCKAPEYDENHGIITNTPNGKLRYYSKKSAGFTNDWSGIEQFMEENVGTQIVFGEENYVYFYDILPKAEYRCWIKGELDGDEITINFPQNVFYTDAYDDYDAYYVQVCRMKMIEEGVNEDGIKLVNFIIDEDRQDIKFKIDDNGKITMEDDAVIGTIFSDNNEWTGNCEYRQEYEVFPYDTIEAPENMKTQKWSFLYENPEISYDDPDAEIQYILRGHLVNVGIDGDDIYIQGFFPKMPQAWVKGHIEGNKVYVTDRQFMGQYKSHNIFLMFATVNNGKYGLEFEFADGPFEFDFDSSSNTLKPVSDTAWLVNSMFDRVLYAAFFSAPTILNEPLTPSVPADPIPYVFYEYDIDYGDGLFEFIMPNYNTEGKLIDTDYYYYNVLIDGELFTFVRNTDLGEYSDIDVPEITDIPYSFNTSYIYSVDDNIHGFTFFIDGFKTIGIQSVYNYGNMECKSNLITYHVDTNTATNDGGSTPMTGISDTSDSPKPVTTVEFYSIDGRRLHTPTKGIFIKKTIFNDGSSKTEKSFVK